MLENKGSFLFSWGIIVLFLAFVPPLGVILLLIKLFNAGSNSSSSAPSLQEYNKVDTRINPAPQHESHRSQVVQNVKKPPAIKKLNATLLKVFGIFLAVFIGIPYMSEEISLASLAFLVGGVAMFVKGHLMSRSIKRYTIYLTIMGEREAVSIDELSRVTGYSPKKVAKDLQKMVENGYLGENAYLNMELGYLFRNNMAVNQVLQTPSASNPREQKAKKPGKVTSNNQYANFLRDIQRANTQINDPALSSKIEQLESITARIFQVVEKDPKKADSIDRFLTYYLPTTQKLLDSYAKFEAAGIEGENLSQAKKRISETMDMLIKGFTVQLDHLYEADAMDITSDIQVMENMLHQDTARTADDFKVQNGRTLDDVTNDFGFGGSAFQRKPSD